MEKNGKKKKIKNKWRSSVIGSDRIVFDNLSKSARYSSKIVEKIGNKVKVMYFKKPYYNQKVPNSVFYRSKFLFEKVRSSAWKTFGKF